MSTYRRRLYRDADRWGELWASIDDSGSIDLDYDHGTERSWHCHLAPEARGPLLRLLLDDAEQRTRDEEARG